MKKIQLVLLCITLGLSLVGCDRFRSVDTLVARAETQYENGNFRAAIGDFKMALQRDTNNTKARIGLARALHHVGEFEDAQHSIDSAVAAGAKDANAIALKYRIMLSRQQFADVVSELSSPTSLPEATQAYLRGRGFAGQGQSANAFGFYARALELSPADSDVLLAQARLYAETGDIAQADEILDPLLTREPENAGAWMLRAGTRDSKGDMEGAKAALESAEKFSARQLNWSEQARVAAALADICLRLNNAADAAKAIANLNRRTPQTPLTFYLQARLAILNKNNNDAISQLQKGLQIGDYAPSQLLLANLQIAQGNFGQAESLLDKVLGANPKNAEARKLMTQVYLATNRTSEAEKLTATGGDDDLQADWLRGQTLFAAGSRSEGLLLLEKAVAADKSNVERSLQLARAYISDNARDKAIALLESLPANAGGSQRQGLLVLASVMGKSTVESAKVVDGLLGRYPNDANLFAVAGVVIAQSGDVNRGIQLLSKAVQLNGKNADARIVLASLLHGVGKYAEAEEHLQSVIAADNKNVLAYAGLSKVANTTGHRDQAVKYLERAISAQPSAVEPRLQLAQLVFAAGDDKRALSLLDQAATAGNNSAAIENAIGALLLQNKQYDSALLRFESAAAKGMDLGKVNAARVIIAQGKKESARERLVPLANLPKIGLPASSLLVRLDTEAGNFQAALTRIDSMRKLGDGKGLDELAGDVHIMAKQFDQAQQRYAKAYQQQPSRQLAIKRFQALFATRDASTPTALKTWLQQVPSDILVRQLLAKYYVQSGDNVAALREYEAWLAATTVREPEMLNDLAWLYGEKDDERALPLALEAYTAKPASGEIADTYGWILLRRNEAAKALPILEKAAQSEQANPEVQYHYAVALSKVGERDRAKSLLNALLAKSAQFPSRREAEQLLRTMGN